MVGPVPEYDTYGRNIYDDRLGSNVNTSSGRMRLQSEGYLEGSQAVANPYLNQQSTAFGNANQGATDYLKSLQSGQASQAQAAQTQGLGTLQASMPQAGGSNIYAQYGNAANQGAQGLQGMSSWRAGEMKTGNQGYNQTQLGLASGYGGQADFRQNQLNAANNWAGQEENLRQGIDEAGSNQGSQVAGTVMGAVGTAAMMMSDANSKVIIDKLTQENKLLKAKRGGVPGDMGIGEGVSKLREALTPREMGNTSGAPLGSLENPDTSGQPYAFGSGKYYSGGLTPYMYDKNEAYRAAGEAEGAANGAAVNRVGMKEGAAAGNRNVAIYNTDPIDPRISQLNNRVGVGQQALANSQELRSGVRDQLAYPESLSGQTPHRPYVGPEGERFNVPRMPAEQPGMSGLPDPRLPDLSDNGTLPSTDANPFGSEGVVPNYWVGSDERMKNVRHPRLGGKPKADTEARTNALAKSMGMDTDLSGLGLGSGDMKEMPGYSPWTTSDAKAKVLEDENAELKAALSEREALVPQSNVDARYRTDPRGGSQFVDTNGVAHDWTMDAAGNYGNQDVSVTGNTEFYTGPTWGPRKLESPETEYRETPDNGIMPLTEFQMETPRSPVHDLVPYEQTQPEPRGDFGPRPDYRPSALAPDAPGRFSLLSAQKHRQNFGKPNTVQAALTPLRNAAPEGAPWLDSVPVPLYSTVKRALEPIGNVTLGRAGSKRKRFNSTGKISDLILDMSESGEMNTQSPEPSEDPRELLAQGVSSDATVKKAATPRLIHELNKRGVKVEGGQQVGNELGESVDAMMDPIKPHIYSYKESAPTGHTGALPKGQVRPGIILQDLEKSPLGATLVINTPKGKMMDIPSITGANMAMIGRLNERLKKQEKKR